MEIINYFALLSIILACAVGNGEENTMKATIPKTDYELIAKNSLVDKLRSCLEHLPGFYAHSARLSPSEDQTEFTGEFNLYPKGASRKGERFRTRIFKSGEIWRSEVVQCEKKLLLFCRWIETS